MMMTMKRVSLLLSTFILAGSPLLFAADLEGVRRVYILQMSHGMDQYLANRLTSDHVFMVVTDPKSADAVLTDHIGETFEQQLDTLLPSPEPVKKVEPPAAKETSKQKDKDSNIGALVPLIAEAKAPPPRSTFGASKGTYFLVDPKTHQVLWSVYDLGKDSDSRGMDRTASDIVGRLKKILNTKK
jgi:hypothetical protein